MYISCNVFYDGQLKINCQIAVIILVKTFSFRDLQGGSRMILRSNGRAGNGTSSV